MVELSQVVIANRDMGSTAVLRVTALETQGMGEEAKRQWCAENGKRLHDEDGLIFVHLHVSSSAFFSSSLMSAELTLCNI